MPNIPELSEVAFNDQAAKDKVTLETMAPLFHSIDNHHIHERDLIKLEKVRRALTSHQKIDQTMTISDAISHNKGSINSALKDIPLSHTLMACLALDSELDAYRKVFDRAARCIPHQMDDDLYSEGVTRLWRGSGIADILQKKKAVNLVVAKYTRLKLSSGLTSIASYTDVRGGSNTPQDLLLMMIMMETEVKMDIWGFDTDTYLISSMALPEFLNSSDEEKRKKTRELMALISYDDDTHALFSWLIPLCHLDILKGESSVKVLDKAHPIIETIIECTGVTKNTPDFYDLVRRAKVHIAMGFTDAMRSLNLTSADMHCLHIDTSTQNIDKYVHSISQSPLMDSSSFDQNSIFCNNIRAMEDAGLRLNVNEVLDIQFNDTHSNPLLLPNFISSSDRPYETIREITKSPWWEKAESIALHTDRTGPGVKYEHETQIAIFSRMKKDLVTEPRIFPLLSRLEQRQLAKDLIRGNLLDAKTLDYIRFEDDIIRSYINKLPNDIKTKILSSDLGL